MDTKSREKPKSLVGKAFWVLRYRPGDFFRTFRGYFLFRTTRWCLFFMGYDPTQIGLGQGVRLQKLRCLRAEKPDAKIRIGDYSIIYENAELAAYANGEIEFGECAVLGDIRVACRYGVKVGRRFMSSWNVFIQDYDPHPTDPSMRARQVESICSGFRPQYVRTPYRDEFSWLPPGEAIEIGDDVWVGANSTILKGAKIGNGCIVATGSVVLAGVYPEASLLAGNPARVIRQLISTN